MSAALYHPRHASAFPRERAWRSARRGSRHSRRSPGTMPLAASMRLTPPQADLRPGFRAKAVADRRSSAMTTRAATSRAAVLAARATRGTDPLPLTTRCYVRCVYGHLPKPGQDERSTDKWIAEVDPPRTRSAVGCSVMGGEPLLRRSRRAHRAPLRVAREHGRMTGRGRGRRRGQRDATAGLRRAPSAA
jgi:hypothetical protein